MVTVQQIQNGFARFIDTELIPNLSGWDKVIIGGASGLFAANLPTIIAEYAATPMVGALCVYDPESRSVDIDKAYQAIQPYIGTEPLPIKIPKIGLTVKLGRKEIDRLYKCIKEA